MATGDKILCIVAGQRAGTTALQSALSSTGRFVDFGEIFQTNEARKLGAFLDYARDRRIQIADFAYWSSTEQHVHDYLEHLRRLAGADRFPLIDVKLNSWGATRPFWSYPHQEPMLMSVLRREDSRLSLSREEI